MPTETESPDAVWAAVPDNTAVARSSVFLPSALMAIAVLATLCFQSTLQWSEHQQLAVAQAGIDVQEQKATKLRAALDAVAASTAKLAQAGNANAKVIVDELRKRGVTINPTPPPKAP